MQNLASSPLVKDHGTGEIADFILVETLKPRGQISFYHCKGAHGAKASDRVADAYEALGQACRSSQWIRSPQLMPELYRRSQERPACKVRDVEIARLKRLAGGFSSNDWNYRVVVVQPGFSRDEITRKGKLRSLILSTYEWLRVTEAELLIWSQG